MINKKTLGAFSIHLLTASGAAWALLALQAAANGAWPTMFLWLGVALIVDGLDGPLARRINLSEALPRWSGETLDLVVDFVTYVFVPAYAIMNAGYLPPVWDTIAGIAIVVTSAIYFADQKMKMDDNHFQGFPAIWNAAAFYFFLIAPSPLMAVIFVAVLVIMTFLPIPFLHPVRVERRRSFNLVLTGIWAVLAIIAVLNDMAPGMIVTSILCVFGVYILAGGYLTRRA